VDTRTTADAHHRIRLCGSRRRHRASRLLGDDDGGGTFAHRKVKRSVSLFSVKFHCKFSALSHQENSAEMLVILSQNSI
jgi:hypothetical protein